MAIFEVFILTNTWPDHFIPYRTFLEAVTRAEFINDYAFTSKYSATTKIQLENINICAKDISFIVHKKTGIIPFSDNGFLDIFIDGRGASAELILESTSSDPDSDEDDAEAESYFHVRSVKVQIHRFKYNYNAYHRWAANLLSPIVRPMVKRLLSRLLEQKIRESFEAADRELHAMAERMRVASIATAGGGVGSIESWINAVLSRPDSARRAGGRRGRAFKVSVGGEDLFPGQHPPGGILGLVRGVEERVEERAVLGEEGGWRSEVFDIRT